MTEQVLLPPNLSYSQKSSLAECGGRYYLERGAKVPQRPGWANVGGTAAHSTTEELDRRLYETGEHIDSLDDIRGIFESFFAAETEKNEGISKFDRSEFRASGRATKEWPDKEGPQWWAQKGPEMCLSWVRWRDASQYQLATVEQEVPLVDFASESAAQIGTDTQTTLALEVECRPVVADVEVVAFVDRVLVRETEDGPEYVVLDLKFGSYEPKSNEQLVDYRIGLKDGYGIDPRWGTYWMGRKGMNTPWSDLHATPYAQVEYGYRMAHEQRMRGDFRYKPGNLCGSCSVNAYCPIYGGEYAGTITQPWEITEPIGLRPPKDRV